MDYKVYNPGNTKPFSKRKSTNCVIIHHTATITCTPAAIVRAHVGRGFNGAGYNWLVMKDGTKYQLRPIWASGAHTIGYNSTSIGVCAEGNYEVESQMPLAQQKSVAEVLDYCNDYYKTKLPAYPHRAKWKTACPGKNYPFSTVVSMAQHWDDKPNISFPGRVLRYIPLIPVMRGTDVRAVQQRLNDLGFKCGLTDGKYGKITRSAVIAFQKARHILVDGKVGKQTWGELFK